MLIRLSLVLILAMSCAPSHVNRIHAVADAKTVATGTWGGEHVRLEISKTGAEVEFDCAHGQITQPIALDKRGNFDVPGTFIPEHGGPVRSDETPPSNPARYSGHLDGDSMNLTVTREKENLGSFTLIRGSQGTLMKCR